MSQIRRHADTCTHLRNVAHPVSRHTHLPTDLVAILCMAKLQDICVDIRTLDDFGFNDLTSAVGKLPDSSSRLNPRLE